MLAWNIRSKPGAKRTHELTTRKLRQRDIRRRTSLQTKRAQQASHLLLGQFASRVSSEEFQSRQCRVCATESLQVLHCVLGVVSQLQPRMTSDNSTIGAEGLGEEVKERRFTAAIQPDDTDALTEVDGEGDVLQD